MVAVAEEEQMNPQTRANRFMRNGFVATTYQECRGVVIKETTPKQL